MKTINSFALVPAAPLIQSLPEIPFEYRGCKLFLISREENITKSSGRGRCAILIKPEELDSKPIRIFSYFISEETAQIILNQIEGFDPKNQPLAFENINELEHDKHVQHLQGKEIIREHMIKSGKLDADDQDTTNSSNSVWQTLQPLGWIVGSVIMITAIWIVLRKRNQR